MFANYLDRLASIQVEAESVTEATWRFRVHVIGFITVTITHFYGPQVELARL